MAGNSLVELPYELHSEIVRYMPLSSQIIYQTQLCRNLRSRLGGRMTLRRNDLYSLLDWRQAAADLCAMLKKEEAKEVDKWESCNSPAQRKSIWDTDSTSTPRPAPLLKRGIGNLAVQKSEDLATFLTKDDDNLRFILDCMHFLGLTKANEMSNISPIRLATLENKLTGIRALGLQNRNGFGVAQLSHVLYTIPALRTVETILIRSPGSTEMYLWFTFVPPTIISSTPPVVETQAIVKPGRHAERGRGLQSGFACLCFSSTVAQRFHVIFHDWYDDEEALGIQNMLECSHITCNACKQTIFY